MTYATNGYKFETKMSAETFERVCTNLDALGGLPTDLALAKRLAAHAMHGRELPSIVWTVYDSFERVTVATFFEEADAIDHARASNAMTSRTRFCATRSHKVGGRVV